MRIALALLVPVLTAATARADAPHHHHHHHHDRAPAATGGDGIYALDLHGARGSMRVIRDRDLLCAVVHPDGGDPAATGHLGARVDGRDGRGAWAWGDRAGLVELTLDGATVRGTAWEGTGDRGAAADGTPFTATFDARFPAGPRSVTGTHVVRVGDDKCDVTLREHHDGTVTGTARVSGARTDCGTITGRRAGDMMIATWTQPSRTILVQWQYARTTGGWSLDGTWGTTTDGLDSCHAGGGTILGGFAGK